MLIERLQVSGLLSFGPTGIDLALRDLNVLIGPNGSGKSNFLEVLSVLSAAPSELARPVKDAGGVSEWLWKGADTKGLASIRACLPLQYAPGQVQHQLSFTDHAGRFELVEETIGLTKADCDLDALKLVYHFEGSGSILREENEVTQGPSDNPADLFIREQGVLYSSDSRIRRLERHMLKPEESILSQIRDPDRYFALSLLQMRYSKIALYRNWSFGQNASFRGPQRTDSRADMLSERGENLPLILSMFSGSDKAEFLSHLAELYPDVTGYRLPIVGGFVQLILEERGGVEIPVSRLSDGTFRYLCLLAILLHPGPPALVAIEEPELGLHPDVIPHIASLLVSASQRMQLVVTTHSDVLVDALSAYPESVVVCEKRDGESQFRRLEADRLKEWLEKYTLGQLWSMGEIGGNRW